MSSKKHSKILENEYDEINETYENYRDEIIRLTNDLKIEDFKEKLQKLKEKENIISRIKSLNASSTFNINTLNKESEINTDEKTTIDYFENCKEVIR